MKRIGWTLILAAIPLFTGCNNGGSASKEGAASSPSAASSAKGTPLTPASEAVAQFLDSFRKGDEEATSKMLTQAALAELKKYGVTVAPPGSPESTFEIGKTAYHDEDKDTAFVEIFWTEPVEGTQEKKRYEGLVSVRLENVGWRVSGLVIQTDPSLDPDVVDFENMGQNIAQDLAQQPQPGQPLQPGQFPPSQPLQPGQQLQPGQALQPGTGFQPNPQGVAGSPQIPGQPSLAPPNQFAPPQGFQAPVAGNQGVPNGFAPPAGGFQPNGGTQVATPPGSLPPIR